MTAKLPPIIYGTAWKEEATAGLVKAAVEAGFRAIDTANQRRHYHEAGVGDALREAYKKVRREDLWLQSKYTYMEGQDHRLPYDPEADYAEQVRQSFGSSLEHLHTDYLDSYVLHGPRGAGGMTEGDWEVWSAMEELQRSGKARMIGVSNVRLSHLKELVAKAKIKPQAVQNRCFAVRGWDKDVREFCIQNGIAYQGFSLLTANPQVVNDRRVAAIARSHEVSPEQVIFAFAVRIGILPLTGTTDPEHMRQDLEALKLELSDDEVSAILG